MKLALIGDPVEHSRSPQIQAQLLRDLGIEGTYEAIRVPAGEAGRALARLRDAGYAGCNVTTPLKEEAAAACERLTIAGQRARSANTIRFERDTFGTTTDGIGVVAALREYLGSLRGREILVLGTGPTARAAVMQLAEEGARLWIWGRCAEKAQRLCETAGSLCYEGGRIEDAVFAALPPHADLPAEVLTACRMTPLVMDANYGERAMLGGRVGRPVVDGSAMLVAQARASLEFWRQ